MRKTTVMAWRPNKADAHKHEYRREDEAYDQGTGMWSKTCTVCGATETFEKM